MSKNAPMQAVSDYQKAFLTYLESQSFLKEPENLYAPISYIMGLGGQALEARFSPYGL